MLRIKLRVFDRVGMWYIMEATFPVLRYFFFKWAKDLKRHFLKIGQLHSQEVYEKRFNNFDCEKYKLKLKCDNTTTHKDGCFFFNYQVLTKIWSN
jgi:hypothetical protein